MHQSVSENSASLGSGSTRSRATSAHSDPAGQSHTEATPSEPQTEPSVSPAPPTLGELERRLEQRIQSAYREWTGHRPQQTLCHFFAGYLTVVIQQSTTPLERLLQHQCPEQLAELKPYLHQVLRQKLAELIQEILAVPIEAVLLDSDSATGCANALVVLGSMPTVRNPKAMPKAGHCFSPNRSGERSRN